MPTEPSSASSEVDQRAWYQRIGPGLITACVVIGPGSILTSSKVGAKHGFSLIWVVVVAVLFMMIYTTLGARLGVCASESAGNLIAKRAGRWLAVLIGIGVFFISAAFQFGNNVGVHSAFQVYLGDEAVETKKTSAGIEESEATSGKNETAEPKTATVAKTPPWKKPSSYLVVLFNAFSISFLFAFKNLYKAVERLMTCFVAVMLISFLINLAFAKPNLGEFSRGFVPSSLEQIDVSLLGLVGTTFVITASFYQSYLVRQKGWGEPELKSGMLDARVGSILMALITIMLMSTAAAVLRNKDLANVSDVAHSLEPLFGAKGQALFCIGLFSAAYSSFLVNSMIGGFILSDGLGLGSNPDSRAPKLFTVGVLLTGMGVGLWAILTGKKPVAAIVFAQATTVLVAPLVAGTLLWLTNLKSVMGKRTNDKWTNAVAGVGLLLLVMMAWYTATEQVPKTYHEWMGNPK